MRLEIVSVPYTPAYGWYVSLDQLRPVRPPSPLLVSCANWLGVEVVLSKAVGGKSAGPFTETARPLGCMGYKLLHQVRLTSTFELVRAVMRYHHG